MTLNAVLLAENKFAPNDMPHPKDTSQAPAQADGLSEGLTAAKRAQILAGAMTTFMREGFAATSMEQIAKEAGVSKGTLYNHFDSKQALFSTIIENECARIHGQVFDLTEITGKPEAVLMKVGIGFVSSVLDPHAMSLYRNMIAESQRFPELGLLFMRSGPDAGSRSLGKYLRRLANEGLLSVQDEVQAAHQFISLCDAGMVNHAHLLADKPTKQQLQAHVASAVRVFLKAYRAEVGA
jgi:TetR/AcrR family transcriptional regulator, mexJK operon transcriptional repressor